MRGWDFPVEIDASAELPIYLQIAQGIANDIRRGRLVARDRLPGSRRLAQMLGVHRNTVLAAYTELSMEGWVITSPTRGTFVSPDLPEHRVKQMGARGPQALGFDLSASSAIPVQAECGTGRFAIRPGHLRPEFMFSSGLPDVRLLPATALGRAYTRALRVSWRTSLMYGDPEGHPKLRAALATMLASTRGLATAAENVFVARGSQMGVWLTARAIVTPGDLVAVEAPGYRPAWEAFRMAGARLVPIDVDEHGIRVDQLQRLMSSERVRAVYITPQHQFPTTVTLSPERRDMLLRLATAHRCAIIEEDYDHEFHYEGRPILPVASMDRSGVVIYIGTLSKVLAPGLRIGFIVAPLPLQERFAAIRSHIDLQGDQCLEYAIAELLEDGEIQRHIARMRRVYRARRDALAETLRRELPDVLSFALSPGGTGLWTRVADGIDVDEWADRALKEGVALSTGRRYDFYGHSQPFVRLAFASLNERDIAEATRRIARCVPARAIAMSAR
jgi:GntR family transcriptional regulator/MocR family aminotransferase